MDNTIRSDQTGPNHWGCCNLSWSAILAGALVAFSLSVLLNMFNAGLGLVVFMEAFRNLVGVSIGGYIWLLLSGALAMFIAGMITGKVVSFRDGTPCHGMLHGFLAWSLALLLTFLIAAHFANAGGQALGKANADNRVQTIEVVNQSDIARAEQAVNAAGTATLGVFSIFMLGALAAALGGYVGAKQNRKPVNAHFTKL